MIFFKQYLITLTFVVIAIWVVPAHTEGEIFTNLCNVLYETGRWSEQYRDIPITVVEVKDLIRGVVAGMAEAGRIRREAEKKRQEAEKKRKQADALKAIGGLIVDEKAEADALKEISATEAKGAELEATELKIKEILNEIAKEANDTKITGLNSKINTIVDIKNVLSNLTIHHSNYLKEVAENRKILCPRVFDFCYAKTESKEHAILFYQSIFNINEKTLIL